MYARVLSWDREVDHVKCHLLHIIIMLVLVRKNKYRSITPKKFFDPELFGSSQLHGFTGKRVRARKKTGILNFYSDNPYWQAGLAN